MRSMPPPPWGIVCLLWLWCFSLVATPSCSSPLPETAAGPTLRHGPRPTVKITFSRSTRYSVASAMGTPRSSPSRRGRGDGGRRGGGTRLLIILKNCNLADLCSGTPLGANSTLFRATMWLQGLNDETLATTLSKFAPPGPWAGRHMGGPLQRPRHRLRHVLGGQGAGMAGGRRAPAHHPRPVWTTNGG